MQERVKQCQITSMLETQDQQKTQPLLVQVLNFEGFVDMKREVVFEVV